MDGRLFYLSFLGGHKIKNMSLAPILSKRLKIMGSTLRSRSRDYKIGLTADFWKRTQSLIEEQKLYPVINSTLRCTETEHAHLRMQENQNTVKIVLTGM